MAKLTKESFIESLKEMSLLEIKELVDAMKEEFGVDPSAVAVAAAPAAGAGDAADDNATVTVVITDGGQAKVNVIKVVREITGLGLKESKDIVDQNGTVKENVSKDEANDIKAKLEEAGVLLNLSKINLVVKDYHIDNPFFCFLTNLVFDNPL